MLLCLGFLLFTCTDAKVDYYTTGGVVYEQSDFRLGQPVVIQCSQSSGCPIFASITGATDYEARISITLKSDTGTETTTLSELANTDASTGLKTPKLFGSSCTITNGNPSAQDRPFYIYAVRQLDSTTYPLQRVYPVYDAAAGTLSSSAGGMTILTAQKQLTLTKFTIDNSSDVALFPGGYDIAQYTKMLLYVINPDDAAKSICVLNSPIVTLSSKGTKVGVTVATNEVTSFTFTPGATLCGASAGMSGSLDNFLTTIDRSAQSFAFASDAAALFDVDVELDLYANSNESIKITGDNNSTVLPGNRDTNIGYPTVLVHFPSSKLTVDISMVDTKSYAYFTLETTPTKGHSHASFTVGAFIFTAVFSIYQLQ